MTKTIRTIIIAAVALLAVAACTKEITADVSDSRGGNPTESGKITVNVEALMGELSPAGDETKSSIAPVVRLTWENTDVVYAYDATQCLGSLTVTPAGNGTSAKLSGEITSTDATKITLVHCNTADAAPVITDGAISFDLSAQGEDDPFVVYGTLDNNSQANITGQVVPFLFATSLIRITATGLDEDAVIDNVKVSGLNTVCKLTVSGDGTPSIEGANLGTITKTAGIDKTNDKGQVLFKVAVPASDASSSDRSVEFTIGGKTCTAAFSGAAIESGKAYSAMAENNAIEGIALNKTSTTIPSGSTETLTATVYPLKSIQAVNWESSNTAVASVDVNGIVTGVAFGTATITATSQDNSSIKAACTVTVDLAYVTIGEKKWATTNLGATTIAGSLATCAGDYYQWGSVDKLYNSITWTDNTTGSFVELETDGFADANLTYKGNANLSDKTNDVVKKTYPGTNWRMPTSQEFKDLYNACGGIYDEGKYVTESCGESTNVDKGVYRCGNYDGVAGFLFVAEDNGPHLFFPAAGYVNGTSLIDAVSGGCYWSSTLCSDSTDKAHFLYFDSSSVNPQDCLSRYVGFSVRPVSD